MLRTPSCGTVSVFGSIDSVPGKNTKLGVLLIVFYVIPNSVVWFCSNVLKKWQVSTYLGTRYVFIRRSILARVQISTYLSVRTCSARNLTLEFR